MDILVDNLWNDFFTQTVFMYLTFPHKTNMQQMILKLELGENINESIIKEDIIEFKTL